ncbi:velvet factor, partial [Russula aff. rugulosa BPL654]
MGSCRSLAGSLAADRRPIDPPPIVQLRVIDKAPGFGTGPFLQNPYYFMFASLAKPDDDTELHWMKVRSCTTGSVVSSLYHLKDSENDNRDAGFFVFPDLSVRQEGSYRLKLSLFEVVGSNVYHCKSIFSTPFYVYTAKKFPGMEESTPLSCSLADQGIKIRIRKDIR